MRKVEKEKATRKKEMIIILHKAKKKQRKKKKREIITVQRYDNRKTKEYLMAFDY